MLLLQVLIVTSTWSYGYSQITLLQTPLSVTRPVSKSARMSCKISGFDFNSNYIHWYRQSPGAAPERILYVRLASVTMDTGFDSKRFEAVNDDSTSTSNLRVHQLTREDAATYYCAAWDTSSGIKYFGTGTKLVVSDIQAKFDSTKIQVLPPSTEQDGKVSYMCLIQDFYPNVIKVTWEVDKKNVEENAVHEEIWDPDTNQQLYSMSSWLTVDKNSNKNYRCKYQHESKEGSRPIESPDTSVVSQTTESCINKPENGTTLSTDITDSFMHRTAYLIYIVLLLKSTTYYVIVLFFIYRMQSPIKHRGKKP
ncbi:immunoglobulin kappa light chain-like isoform X1 [Chelonia mydas]|uniref:immunoglobulin kappa light chain-like isoform X1 n=1 Tax=Chelonia mydas TaxID=8469 RepID=UPI001CA8FDC3|nr:immunoglobulin kappa light chain-like isoform X1 [Chelonia mydas]